jgi:NitT/TauT family transport system permease protein
VNFSSGKQRETGGASVLRIFSGALPLALVACIILAWQAAAVILRWPDYFIPSPLKVAETLGSAHELILTNMAPTVEEAAAGFFVGNAIALFMAIGFIHARTAQRAIYPLAIAIQSIPVVAIAPILVVTLGAGFASKVVMTAIISFFPMLVNALRGLNAIDSSLVELFDSVHASAWEVLVKLRLPNSLPYIFVALRITASASVIGAIIAEWIGAQQGLGFLVINSTYEFNTPLLWAALVASSALVLTVFGLAALLERLAVPWQSSGTRP